MSQINAKPKRKMNLRTRRHVLFYTSMFILPLIQFAIFYFGVNLSSIKRAFTMYEIDYATNTLGSSFAGFENFKLAWKLYSENTYVWKTTIISVFLPLLVSQPLTLIVSYYIFKKRKFAGFFKVMVFMPELISGLVFALLFKYITEDVYVTIAREWFSADVEGLLGAEKTQLATVIFFNVWMGFGGNLLLFSGAMNGISDSIMEAAEIDGANKLQEFIYIILPGIFPTYKQILILSVAGVFGGQLSLMSLFGIHHNTTKQLSTLGMFFYIKTYYAGTQLVDGVSYGVLTAFGLIATSVILPTSLGVRWLLNKYGPSAD